MVNDDINVVAALCSVLPTYTELIIDSSQSVPCITYMQSNNTKRTNAKCGADLQYSDLGYEIKVWAKTKQEVLTNCDLVDDIMTGLGYTMTGGRELHYGNLYCFNMVYAGLAYEI